MTLKRLPKFVTRYVFPLVGWAVAMQLLFDGPWVPHKLDLYALLCYLLIVFGGQIIATDTKRVLQYLMLRRDGATKDMDTILTLRGIGTNVLILLEIATTLWDQRSGSKGVHFPLLCRVCLLTLALPLFFYTSERLLRKQDRELIARKLLPEMR